MARCQVEFPKTHSMRELLDLVARVDVQLADELEAAVVLTPYGVVVRYPDDIPEPLEDEAREAIAMAYLVAEKVQERLSGSG